MFPAVVMGEFETENPVGTVNPTEVTEPPDASCQETPPEPSVVKT